MKRPVKGFGSGCLGLLGLETVPSSRSINSDSNFILNSFVFFILTLIKSWKIPHFDWNVNSKQTGGSTLGSLSHLNLT